MSLDTQIQKAQVKLDHLSLDELSKSLGLSSTEKLLAKVSIENKAEKLSLPAFKLRALFLALASILAAIRLGHLGVEFQEASSGSSLDDMYPKIEMLWNKVEDLSLEQQLSALLNEGFMLLRRYASDFEVETIESVWTLKSQYNLEKKVAQGLKKLMEKGEASQFEELDFFTDEAFVSLHKNQQDAVKTALGASFMVMTGGPGTGKTHTIAMMLRAIRPKRCLLLAPTGKAALQLKRCLDSTDFQSGALTISTLHRALGLTQFKKDPVPLDADCIILDEASMVDLHLMRTFLKALPDSAKVIFVGDPRQLPSVESGSLFADLVAHMSVDRSSLLVHLSHVFRTQDPEILKLHHTIEVGDPNFIDHIPTGSSVDLNSKERFSIYHAEDPEIEPFLNAYFESTRFQLTSSLEDALTFWSKRRLLCPLRRGPLGSHAINQMLMEKAANEHAVMVVPVIVTKTRGSFVNGQLGVAAFEIDSQKPIKALFEGDSTIYTGQDLPDLDLAFCLTVHKTQGSEFDEVFLAFPEGSENFGREALYTAATRAKKQIILWGKKETFQLAVNQKTRRVGRIKELLTE